MRCPILVVAAVACAWSAVGGQSVADEVAAGDRDHAALNIPNALKHYQAALALAPTNYEVLCKAAYDAVDLGEFAPTDNERASLYKSGQEYAQRAVDANPKGAEGHFQLARALGRNALTMGTRDKIKAGTKVHDEALAALAIDPKHAGALHVMGRWNAEIMRLNWAARTIAKTILGGSVFGEASWDNAQRYLEQAVALDPNRIVHRLDLGRVYADRGDRTKAREQFEWIARAPVTDYNDVNYKRQAAQSLKELGALLPAPRSPPPGSHPRPPVAPLARDGLAGPRAGAVVVGYLQKTA